MSERGGDGDGGGDGSNGESGGYGGGSSHDEGSGGDGSNGEGVGDDCNDEGGGKPVSDSKIVLMIIYINFPPTDHLSPYIQSRAYRAPEVFVHTSGTLLLCDIHTHTQRC